MRIAAIALLGAVLGPLVAAGSTPRIDLDRPGALEALARDNPGHYQRVQDILRTADEMPCHTERFGLAVVKYDAQAARCGVLLKTSYPAKRHLTFVLEGTHYVKAVTMKDAGFGAMPVEPATGD